MPKVIDMTGRRVGRLVAIEMEVILGRRAYWRCVCDCGKEHVVRGTKLRRGEITCCPDCGYRRDRGRHELARQQLPPGRRREIALLGAAAAHGKESA